MDLIVVKAKFRVLTADEGGERKCFISSGYRPDHVFETFEDGVIRAHMGDITFFDREQMLPGDEAEVVVRFFKGNDGAGRYIEVGRKWFVNEAHHRIGEATVLKILSGVD
ncbi:hypothetical protein [Mucilaginibacter myungsuensis]|uniref:Elongation factor Tu n=1 Tax=Mucilaginibacter myungsuensis TaxID=649104 RepID=A0A929PXT1_9SPHI|nr:hypothetical protein [Mucilaginibacter myungsuensis]MBE9664188.1 hypothetical protein [Mucilaginibacter myungsuensis]MDN3599891.1 hypothetical protein [Mucilaginibacter myungsuensis]